MPASRSLLAILAGASICVACGGVFVGHKAVSSAQRYMRDALAYRAQAEDFKGRLAIAKGQLADAETRIAEAQRGLTKEQKRILAEQQAGRAGTLSRAANSWLNVKAPSPNYWKGQCGLDHHKHAIWKAPEYSLRAGALVLRSYYLRHGIKTVRGIVERFSTCNHDEYAAFLAKRLGVGENEEIDVIRRMPDLIRHMARFETGRAVPDKMLATLDILGKI